MPAGRSCYFKKLYTSKIQILVYNWCFQNKEKINRNEKLGTRQDNERKK